MKLLFIRFLPALSSLFVSCMGAFVVRAPLAYPWPLALGVMWFVGAIMAIGWRRLSWRDALGRTAPGVLTFMAIGMGFLLEQQPVQAWCLTVLLALVAGLILELLFLSAYDPSRYPVNALSHLNLALIPVGAFFLSASFNSLTIFVRLNPWITIVAWMTCAAVWYFFTSHPSASGRTRWRWAGLGAGIGFHLALLVLLLPVSLAVHGALAAVLAAIPARLRRYGYEPKPSSRVAWSEGLLATALCVSLLALARWA